MPSPTTPTIPARADSATLAKHFQPGEPAVIVKLMGVGNTAPFEFRDSKGARTFVMRWDAKAGGHQIRVPLSIWQANNAKIAHDFMDQRRMSHAVVVTFDVPAAAPMEQPSLTDPLIAALIADPEFAWSWHCNIAMACYDKGARSHDACNAGAALFLSRLTDGKVDTTQHPAYAQTQGAETAQDFPTEGALPIVSADAPPQPTLAQKWQQPQEGLTYQVVADSPAADATDTLPTEKGATDTASDALNVVGPGLAEPTVAPASEVDLSESAEQIEERLEGQNAALVSEEQAENASLKSEAEGTPVVATAPTIDELAYDLVEQPKRIKALAALMGVDEAILRESITSPASKVELVNPGWVRRKES